MRDIDWFQDWGVFWREIGGKKMALCEGLSKRQISLSGGHAGIAIQHPGGIRSDLPPPPTSACSQRWLCGSLVCQQKDEMVVRGEADFAGVCGDTSL